MSIPSLLAEDLKPETFQNRSKKNVGALKGHLVQQFDPIGLKEAGKQLRGHARGTFQELSQEQKRALAQSTSYKVDIEALRVRSRGLEQRLGGRTSSRLPEALEKTERMFFKAAMPPMRGAGWVLDETGKLVQKGVSTVCHVNSHTEQACSQVADGVVEGVNFLRRHTPLDAQACTNTFFNAWRDGAQGLESSQEILTLLHDLTLIHFTLILHDPWPARLGDRREFIQEHLRFNK